MNEIMQKYIESREVAGMVGKAHNKLMRDIRYYIEQLSQSKIGHGDFFVESSYKDANNQTRPCYNITKKGCEFIAHKLTGYRGIEFTAKYINRFHEMEDKIQNNMPSGKVLLSMAILEAQRTIEKLENEQKTLIEKVNVKNQVIEELKPKADYTEKILKNPGLVTITQIAKDYGMSAIEMNQKLRELGIQFKQSGQWLLYREFHGLGYTHSETVDITRTDGRSDIKMNTKWTQKGRLFLYEKLKDSGIIPIIERGMM